MYPVQIVENLGELAGFLLAPPEAKELDENGCFSKEACCQVEAALLLDIGREMRGAYFKEEASRGTDPNSRWRTVSSLQKAVRFGHADHARFAASVAYDMDAKYLMRRLGVVAVEDVAAGNLRAVLWTLAAMGQAAWRRSSDERRVLVFLADALASQKKDRNMTDLLNGADFDTQTPKDQWVMAPTEELLKIGTDPEREWLERSVAVWLAAGTKRYWGLSMPKENDRSPTPVFRMLVEQGLPRAFLYGAAKTASRLGEAFWISFYLMHEQLRQTEKLSFAKQETANMPLCGKLLSAAYDMHTREGKDAIRRFSGLKALKAFKPSCIDGQNYMTAIEEAVFFVEGGLLNERAVYRGSEAVREEAWVNIMARTGLPAQLHGQFFAAVEDNLPVLRKIREEVLWEKMHK